MFWLGGALMILLHMGPNLAGASYSIYKEGGIHVVYPHKQGHRHDRAPARHP